MKTIYLSYCRPKRILRNFILYTLICLLIGFTIGVVLGKSTVEVEATYTSVPEPRCLVEEVEISQPEPIYESLGMCEITAYCKENYPHICNDGDSSTTATGTIPMAGRTIAVDPSVIPYGSEVIINGHTYIAEDCGGAVKGNRIDILFATHEEALAFGVQYAEVSYTTKE